MNWTDYKPGERYGYRVSYTLGIAGMVLALASIVILTVTR